MKRYERHADIKISTRENVILIPLCLSQWEPWESHTSLVLWNCGCISDIVDCRFRSLQHSKDMQSGLANPFPVLVVVQPTTDAESSKRRRE